MKDLLVLLAHLLTTIAKLLGPGGARAIVADSLLMKQQLLVINRSRRRAPNLTAIDRILLGFWSLFLSPHGIRRAAVILKPSTLLKFHDILKNRKYRLLYSSGRKGKPGPKGPSRELIEAIVELKRRNTRFGCRRIAQQINKAFGLNIDKDVVRRVLEKHYHPHPDDKGPSWLTFIGHTKDSLWSIDLFRCESILLKTHWVLVVMDQFTRRIIGFWNTQDLERKLDTFIQYYNQYRVHQSLDGDAPDEVSCDHQPLHAKLGNYSWVSHCNGLFQTPIAA